MVSTVVRKILDDLAAQVVAGGSSPMTPESFAARVAQLERSGALATPACRELPDLSNESVVNEVTRLLAKILRQRSGGQLAIEPASSDALGLGPIKQPHMTGTVVTAECPALPNIAAGQARIHYRLIVDTDNSACAFEFYPVRG